MKFAAVTTFSEKHYELYARRCLETFYANWPLEVKLLTYSDQDLWAQSTWLRHFKQRHMLRSTANYRFDAVRFAHKVAAIDLAANASNREAVDVLIWIDADCITHSVVDLAWLEGLIGEAHFAYLRRKAKYPECGFMMMRINHASVLSMLDQLIRLYVTDELFQLAEWHDSFAIEHCRANTPHLLCKSLSGSAEGTAHPLVNGPLGARLDHLKGKRKLEGRSRRSDLRVHRAEAYWR